MIKKCILLTAAILIFAHQELCWAFCYPLQMSVIPSAQLISEKESICGLRLNIPVGKNEEVTGIDIGLIGSAETKRGIQLNIINGGTNNDGLAIAGLFNFNSGSVRGVQVAPLANLNFNYRTPPDMVGLQVAIFLNSNGGDLTGAQIGIFNYADSVHGLQIGLFNKAHKLYGIQIGLINHATNGAIPYLPVINVAF